MTCTLVGNRFEELVSVDLRIPRQAALVLSVLTGVDAERRPAGWAGCGRRRHTTPDALATSTAATRSKTRACS
jgi:hypothetical protein